MIYRFVLLAVCVIAVFPIFSLMYYATNDGPIHISMAAHFASISFGGSPLSGQFFEQNALMAPSSALGLVSALALEWIGPNLLEKLIQTVCIVLPILAAAHIVKADPARSVFAAGLIGVMAHSQMLQLGLYSFMISVGVWIALLALIMRTGRHGSIGAIVAVLVTFAALYWLHAYVAVIGLGILVVSYMAYSFLDRAPVAEDVLPVWRRWVVVLPIALALPALLTLAYMSGLTVPDPTDLTSDADDMSRLAEAIVIIKSVIYATIFHLPPRLISLAYTSVLTTHQVPAVAVAVPVLIWGTVGFAIWARLRDRSAGIRPTDFLLIVVLLTAVTALMMPDNLGGGWGHRRRAALMFLVALALWAACVVPRRLVPACSAVTLVVMVATTYFTFLDQRVFDRQSQEVVDLLHSVDSVSVVLPVVYSNEAVTEDGTPVKTTVNPMYHVFNRLEGTGDVVVLANFLARLRPYLLRFRADMNPYIYLFTDWFGRPLKNARYTVMDVQSFETQTRQCIDTLAVYGRPEHTRAELVEQTEKLIGTFFVPLTCSESGLTCVYRREGAPEACPY